MSKKPILAIYIAHTSKSVWVGFLENLSPGLLNDLQKSLFDDEQEEKFLAEMYLGDQEDLSAAIASGLHPAKYLQENCKELFLGDYIEQKIEDEAA